MIPDLERNRRAEIVMIILAVMLGAVAVLSLLLAFVRTANPSAVCLTKSEARQLWPRRHLYWYSSDHCWSNRRGGPPTGVKYDLIRENHAESLPANKSDRAPRALIKVVRAQDYNELDAQADADIFFNAQPVPYWRFSALDDGFETWKRRLEDLFK